MSEFSERLLRALAVEDAWLHSHAIAFAQAANRELIQSDDTRLREYSEVFVKMQPSAQKRVFEQLWALVDRGVFVATGATPRTKIPGTESYVLFKLAYRKMFGLTSKVPLGMRDRFEISGPRLSRWLSKPTGDSLMPRRRKQRKKPSRRLPDPEAAKPQSRRRSGKAYVLKGLLDLRPNRTPEPVAGSGPVEDGGIKPALLYDTEIEQARLAGKAQIAIANMWIVAAAGFEDRSIGAWENLLRVGKPAGVTLLCYHGNRRLNRTNEGRILALLRQASIPHIQCQSAEIATEEVVALTTQRAGGQDVAVDVTSLSKPLIFSLAREFVRRRDRLTVLHTSAQTYYPRDAQLRPVVQLLGQGAYRDAFDALERAVVGERGPYGLIPVGRSLSDPSRPVFLALFVSLKFDPVDALIKGGEPESLIAYYPVHSRGEKGVRSIVAKYLGEHVADTHGGSCKSIPSMGAREAYSELRKSYEEFALNRSHNFEIGLAGTKMHAVGAAMFASIAPVSAVWYARPSRFDRRWFTEGTGRTVAYRIRRLIRDQPQTT
jgi:hypothetical protein